MRGRDQEIQQLLHHCRAGRLAILTAQPGMGITTLLKERIAPALREEGFIVAYYRDWQSRTFRNNLQDFIAECVRDQADERFAGQTETLSEMLERIRYRTGRPVALLFDQFEDYLRCHIRTELSDSFDAELANAVSSRQCQLVLAMHADAVAGFHRFEQYIPNLMGCHVTLGPLNESEARQLMAATSEAAGVAVDPAVADAMLRTPIVAQVGGVAHGGGFHPFYLSAGLRRLLNSTEDRKWTAADMSVLNASGGAERLILESLDDKFGALNPMHTELFFRWRQLLTSAKDERLAVTPEALAEFSGKLNRFAATLIPILLANGMLREIELPGGMRYEIARDSFTPMIRDWWKRREVALLAQQRVAFRRRSISIAVGSIVMIYMVYLIWSLNK
jgi:hypothetical protein